MHKALILVGMALLVAGGAEATNRPDDAVRREGVAKPAPQVAPVSDQMLARLITAQEKMTANDLPGARADLLAMVDDPAFGSLPADKRHMILVILGFCEIATGDADKAYMHLSAAGAPTGDPTDRFYYLSLTLSAAAAGHKDESAEALIRMAEQAPEDVSWLDVSFVRELMIYLRRKDDGGVLQRRVLESLWDADYVPRSHMQSVESVWFDLFEAEVAAGNDARAREVLATFSQPETVIKLRCDKRYARFIEESPEHGDFKAALDASIVTARTLVDENPRDMEAVSDLAYRLANANRLEEALAVSDAVISRANASPPDAPAYDEQAEKLQWIYMDRSLALRRLGRVEDTLQQQESARDSALQGGGDSVSQPINLGGMYVSEGRPQDALDVMANVDGHVSAYGLIAVTSVRACAYRQLNDEVKLAEAMALLRAKGEDGYGPYRNALMCVGDADGLAQLMIARLENPLTRNQTLYWLQGFLTGPQNDFERGLTEVCARAQANEALQAAIRTYGNVESYAMFRPIDD